MGFDDGARHGTDDVGLAKEGKSPNSSTSIAVWRRCARSNLRPVWLRPRLPSSDFSSVTCQQRTIRQSVRRDGMIIRKVRRYTQQQQQQPYVICQQYLAQGWRVLSLGCAKGLHQLRKRQNVRGTLLDRPRWRGVVGQDSYAGRQADRLAGRAGTRRDTPQKAVGDALQSLPSS